MIEPLKTIIVAHIKLAIQDQKGNITKAAKVLGISRAKLYRCISRDESLFEYVRDSRKFLNQ